MHTLKRPSLLSFPHHPPASCTEGRLAVILRRILFRPPCGRRAWPCALGTPSSWCVALVSAQRVFSCRPLLRTRPSRPRLEVRLPPCHSIHNAVEPLRTLAYVNNNLEIFE